MAKSPVPSPTLSTRMATIAVGHTFKKVEEFFLDQLVYGFMVIYCTHQFGVLWGGVASFAIMAPTSALACRGYIWVYDKLNIDVFGFEFVKEVRASTDTRGIKRIVRYFTSKGDIFALFFLSIYYDPFMTTIYLRKGSFDGLTPKDKKNFWWSVAIANGYWVIRWSVIVELASAVFAWLPEGWRRQIMYILEYLF